MKTNKNKQKIVTIGGGSGSFTVLSGLKEYPVDLSAVVVMFDDGGSTGILREELGVLPPGDVRQCLVALSQSSQTLKELFNYRYESGGLGGHSFGNIFLSTLEKITGSLPLAIKEASRLLRIKGYIFPVTLDNTRLFAVLKNDTEIVGEKNICVYEGGYENLDKLYLNPEAKLNPRIFDAIKKADKIVINPGNLYSSLIPNFLVKGLAEAIVRSKAKVICVANLMTRKGQTDDFNVQDHVDALEKYLGKGIIKYVIVNTETPDPELIKKYAKAGEEPVITGDLKKMKGVKAIKQKLLNPEIHQADKNDSIGNQRSFIRHDPKKLAKIIYDL